MSKANLAGNLAFLGLPEIIQLLGSSGASGVLRLKSKYSGSPGNIYFTKGHIVSADLGKVSGSEAVYPLFGWTEGEFDFTQQKHNKKRTIHANQMELILDGLRMLDEGTIEKVGGIPFAEIYSGKSPDAKGVPFIKGPLIDYGHVVDMESFAHGHNIVKESQFGNWLWVIIKGAVDIVRDTDRGPLTLVRIGEGSFIGSMASLLFPTNIRSATVVAVEMVQLGVLDSQRLSGEFSHLSLEFRNMLISIDKRLRETSNKAVDLYLRKHRIKEAIAGKRPFVRQGGKMEDAFLINKGNASVITKTDFGDVLLADLEEGDSFGYLPFLSSAQEPHSASVFVSKDMEATKMDMNSLQAEYDNLSTTMKNILENVTTSIAVSTKVACEFFRRYSA